MHRVVLCLVMLWGAGCISPLGVDNDGCGLDPDAVHWNDPGMWDAINVSHQGPLWSLDRVSHSAVGVLARPTGLSLFVEAAVPEVRIEAAARSLVENTTSQPDEVDATVAAFMATRRADPGSVWGSVDGEWQEIPHVEYHLEHTWDADRILERLDLAPDASLVHQPPFKVWVDPAHKTRTVEHLELRVSAFGSVLASHDWTEADDGTVIANVTETLRRAGLPPPVDADVWGDIC